MEKMKKQQEVEKTPEDPQDRLKDLNRCTSRLEELIKRINITNCFTIVDGTSITAMIAITTISSTREVEVHPRLLLLV